MKIAFWSNANDNCSVSANLAAISVVSVIRYPYTVIMMENRLSSNNLGYAFWGNSRIPFIKEPGANYYDGGGLEGLIRNIYRSVDYSGILRSHLKDIITNHLYYIPQDRVIHNEIFDYELDHCIQPLLKMMEEFADICIIDTASHQNLSTKTILEDADLIVVNLCQKQNILEDFFLNYSSLISKAVFIINNYNKNLKLNYKRIALLYDIPLDNLVVLPGNESYQNAYVNGCVKEFIYRNYNCMKENSNFQFMQALKKATYIIIKKTVEAAKQKESSMCY